MAVHLQRMDPRKSEELMLIATARATRRAVTAETQWRDLGLDQV